MGQGSSTSRLRQLKYEATHDVFAQLGELERQNRILEQGDPID